MKRTTSADGLMQQDSLRGGTGTPTISSRKHTVRLRFAPFYDSLGTHELLPLSAKLTLAWTSCSGRWNLDGPRRTSRTPAPGTDGRSLSPWTPS